MPAERNVDPYLIVEKNAVQETGIDRVSFLIAPNVGEPLKDLSHIVSGGELSRIVLALKAILAQTEAVETIVFDEVDAGIGGGVADVVGKKLSDLAGRHQIICITHLPQIAKFGDHHFSISKHVSNGRTKTFIKRLNEEERVQEIARMLGGEKITKAIMDHAREMLDSARPP
jgi:DNA repair protein RecN (Recombination protein N)